MMKNRKLNAGLLGVGMGVCLLVVLCGIALALLLGCDILYRLDVKLLDIESYSGGYDYDTIMRNYRATVAYLNPFKDTGVFSLPDFAVSEAGAIHFEDVKRITDTVFLLAGVLVLPLAGGFVLCKRDSLLQKPAYRACGITVLAVPAIVLAAVAADPDWFFVMFHKIFFSNDFWIFDWNLDQVIRILPMEFFIHCAIVIAMFWAAGSAVMFIKAAKAPRRG